jgi:hypothetical protein
MGIARILVISDCHLITMTLKKMIILMAEEMKEMIQKKCMKKEWHY